MTVPREEIAGRLLAEVRCRGVDDAAAALSGPGSGDLATALDLRRSVRTFSSVPVGRDDLCAVIEAGLAADREMWPGETGLEVVVLADRDPGSVPTSELILQLDLAAAAAVLVVCGDLPEAVRRHGGHGYRQLLTRAGAVVATCQLAAIARGWHGCPFDGLLPGFEVCGASVDDVPLFALALGV